MKLIKYMFHWSSTPYPLFTGCTCWTSGGWSTSSSPGKCQRGNSGSGHFCLFSNGDGEMVCGHHLKSTSFRRCNVWMICTQNSGTVVRVICGSSRTNIEVCGILDQLGEQIKKIQREIMNVMIKCFSFSYKYANGEWWNMKTDKVCFQIPLREDSMQVLNCNVWVCPFFVKESESWCSINFNLYVRGFLQIDPC